MSKKKTPRTNCVALVTTNRGVGVPRIRTVRQKAVHLPGPFETLGFSTGTISELEFRIWGKTRGRTRLYTFALNYIITVLFFCSHFSWITFYFVHCLFNMQTPWNFRILTSHSHKLRGSRRAQVGSSALWSPNQVSTDWPAELKDLKLCLCSQKAHFPQILFTSHICLNLSGALLLCRVNPSTSRCDISRCWLDSMVIAQVCLGLGTITGHSKTRTFTLLVCTVSDVTTIASCSATHTSMELIRLLIVVCGMLVPFFKMPSINCTCVRSPHHNPTTRGRSIACAVKSNYNGFYPAARVFCLCSCVASRVKDVSPNETELKNVNNDLIQYF